MKKVLSAICALMLLIASNCFAEDLIPLGGPPSTTKYYSRLFYSPDTTKLGDKVKVSVKAIRNPEGNYPTDYSADNMVLVVNCSTATYQVASLMFTHYKAKGIDEGAYPTSHKDIELLGSDFEPLHAILCKAEKTPSPKNGKKK